MTRIGRYVRQAFIAGELRAFSIIHQSAFTLLLGSVSIALGLLRTDTVHIAWLATGLVLLLLATVGAYATNLFKRTAVTGLIIPLLDFAALGMCRYATYPDGGGLSILSVIPTVWLVITLRGRGGVIATAAVLLAVTPVTIFDASGPIDAARILLAAILPVAIAMIAGMVMGFDLRARASSQRLRDALYEQQKLTDNASRSSALLKAIGESVDVGLLVFNRASAPIFGNSAFQAHLSQAVPHGADVTDDSIWSVFAADSVTEVAPEDRPLARARRGEVFRDELFWVGPPTKAQKALTMSTTSLGGDDRVTPHMIVVTYDVTATQELIRSRENIMAAVSHELRTPLTSIIGYTELAIDELAEESPAPATASEGAQAAGTSSSVARHLEVIRRNSDQLYALIEDILLEQQAESQRLQLSTSPIDLGSLIGWVVRSLQPVAANHQVDLMAEDHPRARVNADSRRITQVLTNLIVNALKYSGPGHHVTVAAKVDRTGVGFDVNDDGPGMPRDEVDRLFAPFFRGQAARRSAQRGVGLGLSVTKNIIDAHGGTVTVSSVLGQGSTFSVRLPSAAAGDQL